VLAAQFESFVSAVILIATVPFGLLDGADGGSLNIYSQIGLILLVGLMAKNGILIVEFANQLRDQGQSVREAIRNASIIRLRPVVMTMIATILGGLPLILTGGAGSEARQALGWVVVGGLAIATFATLFVTPVVFDLLARFSRPGQQRSSVRARVDEAGGPRGMRRRRKSWQIEPATSRRSAKVMLPISRSIRARPRQPEPGPRPAIVANKLLPACRIALRGRTLPDNS
jgi:HAE1 family hydrophobic/amphiphilic exporter-1